MQDYLSKIHISQDIEYLLIFTLVIVLPKLLVRWKLPSGITALIIGVLFAKFDPELAGDKLFRFLSQVGITSLFVFAGLEVEINELKKNRQYLTKYLLKSTLALLLVAFGLMEYFDFSYQSALILSLGILTPSAGFIINSLKSFEMGKDIEYWIKSKAISKEIIAIILLFIALQIDNYYSMAIGLIFFIGLFITLPYVFKFFFKFISPYVPNFEVPMLVLLSLISGVISKELGAYYLVGAFIVGLIGSRFKSEIFTETDDVIFKSLNSFFNIFLPFYFFYAGLKLSLSGLSKEALLISIAFFVIFIPIRLLLNSISLKHFLKDIVVKPHSISVSLMPTLVFGLVIAGILIERKEVDIKIIYALILYTIFASLLPTILLNMKKQKSVD